jgi:hypothetical protein
MCNPKNINQLNSSYAKLNANVASGGALRKCHICESHLPRECQQRTVDRITYFTWPRPLRALRHQLLSDILLKRLDSSTLVPSVSSSS